METTTFEDSANSLRDRIRPEIDRMRRRLESLNGGFTTFIKDHPAACLVGAVALGYVVARVARRQRS